MASSSTDYFRSYNSLYVHELMIKDKPRTEAYKFFIEKNSDLIKDKVVLDIGAGTGILSLFAARAGAKKVYAVEASDVATLCKEIIKANKFENVITVMNEMVENVELPERVDVIVSEWMGFYLLHESMLDSVLCARDKWLKEEGILLPSHATIYACPVNMSGFCRDTFEYWEDVYGFDFGPFQERTIAAHLNQPTVINLKEGQLLAEPCVLQQFDLKTMKISEAQEIVEKLSFKVFRDSVLHGFAAWFDVVFAPGLDLEDVNNHKRKSDSDLEPQENGESFDGSERKSLEGKSKVDQNGFSDLEIVTLSTSPFDPDTHWKQTVCFLPVTTQVESDETILCKFSLDQDSTNKRHYNITLQMLDSLDDTDDDDDSDEFEEDTSRHPVPCDCGSGRCRIISALVKKYDEEQNELEMEAEFDDVSAEVQAAQNLDKEDSNSLINTASSDKTE